MANYSATSYSSTSPYFSTSLNNNYLDIIEFRNIPAETDDILFEITKTYEYRPDLLAYDLYKDVNLWWVFAVRNKSVINDSIFDFVPGTRIYLPKLSTIKTALGF
jgi:hypothetical protein